MRAEGFRRGNYQFYINARVVQIFVRNYCTAAAVSPRFRRALYNTSTRVRARVYSVAGLYRRLITLSS